MKLITGTELDSSKFFSRGTPTAQGSSFDLSIGKIYDKTGAEVKGPFTLKPGHMVQVVSAEVFALSNKITGHVTYKTGLTRMGIWALTVGIVDPGWDGPIATTLLNFSKVEHTIHVGDKFLRVSLFEHDPVPLTTIRHSPPLDDYLKDVQCLAASRFPSTFLNSDQIAEDAGKAVMNRIRTEALTWLGITAILFTLIQVFAPPLYRAVENSTQSVTGSGTQKGFEELQVRVQKLEQDLLKAKKQTGKN